MHWLNQSGLVKTIGYLKINIDLDSSLMFAGKVVATIALASLSGFLLERPILNLKERFRPAHHPST